MSGVYRLNQSHAGGIEASAGWVADDRVKVLRSDFNASELVETTAEKVSIVAIISLNGLVGTGNRVA